MPVWWCVCWYLLRAARLCTTGGKRGKSRGGSWWPPSLLWYEVTNALYRYELAGWLSPEETQQALDMALALGVRVVEDGALHSEAALLARDLGLSGTYDAHYLAAARRSGAEFWTADQRLVRQVAGRLNFVRLAAE